MIKSNFAKYATVALLMSCGGMAQAQQTVWEGIDNDWFNPANWSAGTPEGFGVGAVGSARIEDGSDLEVASSVVPVGVTSLEIYNGSLEFSGVEVELHGFDPADASGGAYPRITVGGADGILSSLSFTDGATLTGITRNGGTDVVNKHEIVVGGSLGALGALTVSGVGTQVTSNLRVGVDGTQMAGSTGATTLPQNSGVGSLVVSDNAVLSGDVLVIGANRGQATANLSGGAKVTYLKTHIGGHKNSSGVFTPIEGSVAGSGIMTVSGANTVLNETSSSRPGYFLNTKVEIAVGYGVDNGELEIVNGGTVNANILSIADGKTGSSAGGAGNGVVRVSGAGSSLNLLPADTAPYGSFMPNNRQIADGVLHIGRYGSGKLIIADGATVAVQVGSNPSEIPAGVTYMAKTAGQVTLGANGGTGILQIGEGGAAGTLDFNGSISGGSAGSEVFFNHNEANYEFSANIGGGSGSTITVRVESGGSTLLSGTNRHRGGTIITDGTIVAGTNAAFAAAPAGQPSNFAGGGVFVDSLGTLEVSESVTDLVIAGDLVFEEGGTLAFTLGEASAQPLLRITDGNAALTPGLVLNGNVNLDLQLASGTVLSDGFEWRFLEVEGTIAGFDLYQFNVNLDGFTVLVDDNALILAYQAIPEPSSVLLSVLGVGLCAYMARRKSQAGAKELSA